MVKRATQPSAAATVAIVGVVESGSAVALVTVASDGALLDRRDVALIEPGMPTHPHHHEGSWAVGRYLDTPGARPISLAEAVALVERVRAVAAIAARAALDEVAAVVHVPIAGIALRACPEMPPTIEERIADARVQTFADSAMYRDALADAAIARGWNTHRYDRDHIVDAAASAMQLDRVRLDEQLRAMGRLVGSPWQARHKLAAAAALAFSSASASGSGSARAASGRR